MREKLRILVICQHNSGRSQIAEAYLQQLMGDAAIVESAGLEPAAAIDPLIVKAMAEEGIDISGKRPEDVFDKFKTGVFYAHVITVCDDSESKCPIFPGFATRWHRPFPNPTELRGTDEERLNGIRLIRGQIKAWLTNPPTGEFSYRQVLDDVGGAP